MSTLAVNTITNAAGGNTAQINGMTPTADSLQGFRNRLINPGMVIDQRNAGALINPAVSGFTVDRWSYFQNQTSKGTIGQNAGAVTPPVGFTNYLGFTSTSAYALLTADQFLIRQDIEGLNTYDLAWGTASAATVTLSFWVRSSLTGSFGGAIQNSGRDRNYPFAFAINSANTWEYKTVTIVGDTTGTWLTTNGRGICVTFSLGTGATYSATAGAWTGTSFITAPTGATSVVGTSGATFYITGVQLEAGSVATAFEQIDYGRELMLCQRYYQVLGEMWLKSQTTANYYTINPVSFVPMRAAPTVTYNSVTTNVSYDNLGSYSISTNTVSVRARFTSVSGTGYLAIANTTLDSEL